MLVRWFIVLSFDENDEVGSSRKDTSRRRDIENKTMILNLTLNRKYVVKIITFIWCDGSSFYRLTIMMRLEVV